MGFFTPSSGEGFGVFRFDVACAVDPLSACRGQGIRLQDKYGCQLTEDGNSKHIFGAKRTNFLEVFC